MFDFLALKKFESLHPELFINAEAPPSIPEDDEDLTQLFVYQVSVQINAFNAVFSSQYFKS